MTWRRRRKLKELAEPERARLHALALARGERDARKAIEKARKKLGDALEGESDPKAIATLAAGLHDNARTVASMRVSHAKLTGTHAPERTDLTSGGKPLASLTDAEIDARIAAHEAARKG